MKRGNVRLLTSVQFFRGKIKVYESALLEVHDVTYPDRKASAFELEVPSTQLKPGWYTCQINVVDDAGGTFAFPRLPILIKGVETKTAQATAVRTIAVRDLNSVARRAGRLADRYHGPTGRKSKHASMRG